jgi:hypothetical protein
MSAESSTPEEEAALDGTLGGGVSGPENGVSAGVDDADRAAFEHPHRRESGDQPQSQAGEKHQVSRSGARPAHGA